MSNKSSETLDNYCCVRQCRNYKNIYAKMDLYPLPADLMRREKFCKILGIPRYVGSNPAARVCALHFKSKVGSYRPSPPTVPQAIFAQPVTLMIQDGRRHIKPLLPRIQPTSFPAPVQQPLVLQQPVTLAFNPRPVTNMQQNESPKEPPDDISIDKIIEDDLIKNDTPCNSPNITLQLECEEDLLSTTQLNAYMKDLMDFVNANELVYKLPPPEPKGLISPLIASNNSASDELPPLEPIIKNTSIISNPATLSSSIPNSQFFTMFSPSNKGIGVVSNSLSLFNNVISNSSKVETITTSSSACPPLFVHSPVLTPRTVSNTVSDKNSAFISMNGKPLSGSSIGATLSTNGLVSRCGQISTAATSSSAVNILSDMKLNSTFSASGSSLHPQTVTTSFLPITSNGNPFPNLSPLTNSISSPTITKNPSGIQANSVYQILPEKYKIVNAVSNNTAIPVMLLKALDFNDTGQSFIKPTTSASNSPVTIVGRDPDETETCAASLCDVTLDETPEQILVSQEQTISSNDQSTMYNQANGSSVDKISIHDEIKEPPVCAEESQPSSSKINGQIGPVIVDVISAKEGATEYFNGNAVPNILLDNSKKAEDSNNALYTNQLDASVRLNLEKVINSTVDKIIPVTHKDSIFNLQKSIPVIPNGYLVYSEPLRLFKIKTPMPIKRIEEAENLRKKLQLENFIPLAVWWLIQRRYMPPIQSCELCGSKKFIVDKNDNYPDGFCWTCANTICPVQKPIKRPAFFERFKLYSIRDLLLLTYHWACQSSFEEITQDVNMDCEKIWYYFKALQELCHQVAIRKGKLGLVPGSMVETSVVKMGDVFILGAMDRKTRYVRLEALTELEAYESSRHISLLEQWVNKHGTIISENQLPDTCLLNIQKVAADPIVLDPNSSLPHTLNISKYLSKNMTTIFGMVNQHTLKKNDIQGFLYELQWRVKYGKFVDMSFWSILNHIREQNPEESSTVQIRKGEFPCDLSNMEVNNAFYVRWGPNFEDGEKNSEDPEPKLSGKDTKSYSKESNGCFSDYFHDIPEIVGGCSMVTSKSLLAVKIRFGESPNDIDFYKSDAICLGLKLKSEGFITNPIKWLVKKGFIKNTSICYVCRDVALLKASTRFNDGCSWLCQNEKCKFENAFRRPSFFARFSQYSMSHIAGLIFHWIVQSDESLINTDIPMDSCKLLDFWRSFQVLCSSALKRKKEKIGGEEHIVEVAVIRFGKLTILGAMDRETKRPLIQAFPAEMGKIDNLYYTLYSWIHPKSIIVVDATKKFQMQRRFDCYKIILANTHVVDSSHLSCHVLNIKYYLLNHLSNMFSHIKPELMRQEVMQNYLEELMWRDHYGKEPQQAFVYMMNEIFYNDLRSKSDFLLEKKEPEFIPVTFKELRVVLRRIPKSVLKFYGCEISDSTKTSESTNSTISQEEPSSSALEATDDIQVIEDTVQCSNEKTVESDDEIIILDAESSSNIPENKEIVLEQSPTSELPDVSECTSSSAPSEICTNKVQPLVIKMHKKRKKFRSYLKSELEKVKKLELEKDLQNGISDIPNTALRTDLKEPECDMMEFPDIISSDSSHSNTWETQSTDSAKSSKKVTRNHSARYSSSVQKEKVPKCIECGETVSPSYDHFSKLFNCTDCKKNSVYMTCCSKAFFEHRGSILFGKRMPRRMKEDYGLHRPIIMQFPWHCACGFNTKNGNKLASHMLKCRKRTCYYHQNVL
ncbi:uncharacterized protein LOC129983866 [Argiope bruennichi]|uniref:uncharacterized protein LOC129983866 n=1 Tax=Argiope bruennichi TaxID=94029 RepID=UPI002494BAEE|nr:uncharacterized protein LOC129983866 [Argiope bruennichi]